MSTTASAATRASRPSPRWARRTSASRLEYAGGDRLYLPVENIELLSRYGHEEGLLDKLGGGAWQAKKARLKAAHPRHGRAADPHRRRTRAPQGRGARRRPTIAPGRSSAPASPMPRPTTSSRPSPTCSSDMESGKPMDRLVCGDVGFGKTEVALRAAYVAAAVGHAGRGRSRRRRCSPASTTRASPSASAGCRSASASSRASSPAKEAAETRAGLADGIGRDRRSAPTRCWPRA